MRIYQMWNTATANLVTDSDSESDLLDLTREMVQTHGRDAVNGWALGWADDENDDDSGPIAWGDELIERALSHARGTP